MPETGFSICTAPIGRLRHAVETERTSLSRSNGSRRPSLFKTTRSRSWMRSKVVKRAAHASPWGRRRIAARSDEHTSELQSLMRNSYAVLCLQKNKNTHMSTDNREPTDRVGIQYQVQQDTH